MPKAVRSTSQGQYRNNPIAIASRSIAPSNTSDLYYPIAPTMQSHMPSMSLPSLMGGPVQYPRNMSQDMVYEQSIQQNPAQLPSPAVQPLPVRASSGAWTPQDDQVLMTARSAGQNWAPIQATYFPNKTPNACRKRHERLMDRRNSDEWDIVKLEVMAKEYMSIRKDMWTMLAERTGEKWTVLEQKCMQSGLKNLQSQSRACARRERLGGDPYQHISRDSNGGYTDDSGFGSEELGLDNETEDQYSGATDGFASLGHNIVNQNHQHQHQQQQQSHHTAQQQHYSSGRSYQHGPQGLTPETDGGKSGYDTSRSFDRSYGNQMLGHAQMHGRNHSLSMQGDYHMAGRVQGGGSMGIRSIINSNPNA